MTIMCIRVGDGMPENYVDGFFGLPVRHDELDLDPWLQRLVLAVFSADRRPLGFAVTHFGQGESAVDATTLQLRSYCADTCRRYDSFDLFHLHGKLTAPRFGNSPEIVHC